MFNHKALTAATPRYPSHYPKPASKTENEGQKDLFVSEAYELDARYGSLESALCTSDCDIAFEKAEQAISAMESFPASRPACRVCESCHKNFPDSRWLCDVHGPLCRIQVVERAGRSRAMAWPLKKCPGCRQYIGAARFNEHLSESEACGWMWKGMSVVEKKIADPNYVLPKHVKWPDIDIPNMVVPGAPRPLKSFSPQIKFEDIEEMSEIVPGTKGTALASLGNKRKIAFRGRQSHTRRKL